MKTTKLITLVLMMFFGNIAIAQSNYTDVVYLKNGSIIKGVIVEQIPNVSIKIQQDNGSIFVYAMDEVMKTEREVVQNDIICHQAITDAGANYTGEGSLSGVTWATTLITSPLFGLIPATIGANSTLDNYQLNAPDPSLLANNNYQHCYKQEAMQMKKKKSWNAYLLSSVVWLGATIFIYSALY